MVTNFICHDEGTFTAVGSGVKLSHWKIRVGDYYDEGCVDLEIKLAVDMSVIKSPKVRIEHKSRGKNEVLHPKDPDIQKDVLTEDFEFSWPFRGSMPGIGVKGMYEVRLPGTDSWFPARLDKQQLDGSFETVTFQPTQKKGLMEELQEEPKIREVKYTTIGSLMRGEFDDIRHADTKQKVRSNDKVLTLAVPKIKPLDECCITCESGEETHMVTHFFARPTPCPAEYEVFKSQDAVPCASVQMIVDKERKYCEANIGHARLQEYLLARPRFIVQQNEKLWSQWKFTVGLATHTVRVEKKKVGSKLITLSVDNEVLVEAAAKDVDGDDGEAIGTDRWVVTFKLIGAISIDFSVYPTNRDGLPIEDSTPVSKIWRKKAGKHLECSVSLGNNSDCRAATLTLGGVPFSELEEAIQFHEEANLTNISADDFGRRYGWGLGDDLSDLQVPHEIDMDADYGVKLMLPINRLSLKNPAPEAWVERLTGMFACICKPRHEGHEYEEPPADA